MGVFEHIPILQEKLFLSGSYYKIFNWLWTNMHGLDFTN